MMHLTGIAIVAIAVASCAGLLAGILFARGETGSSWRSISALLWMTALAHLANALGVVDEARVLLWHGIATIAEMMQPAAVLYAGLALMGPVEQDREASVLRRARVIAGIGMLMACLVAAGQVFEWKILDGSHAVLGVTLLGRIPYVFVVTGMALGLAQLELVLRASREPVRHKLKFVVIGLGGLAGYQIYQASQMLLISVWQVEQVLVSSVVTAMALCLGAYGIGRTRLREIFVNTYISQQALFGSVTFIVVGLYLLAVGAVGEWLRLTDQPLGLGLSVVVVFGALVGLVIAAFSKTVRAEIRGFLARNFYRSRYDYRAQWLHVTKVFEQAVSRETIMDRLLDLLITTFPTKAISIWSFREADRRFCQIRSMVVEGKSTPLELSHPVITQLQGRDEPVLMEEIPARLICEKDLGEDPLMASGITLCFPIRAQGRLTAFVALGQQLHGEAYGTDECDLLRGISHHVGVLLAHASLAEERQSSAELEALHRFSVFCLHDLKNLAARLSLVAQNAEAHGHDPDFQQSAMRTVTDTATKMTALLSKLSLASLKPAIAGAPESVDVSALIEEIVAPIRREGKARVVISKGGDVSVIAVWDQLHQVLLNVILNAKQAIEQDGTISIGLVQGEGSVILTVDDTGRGIAPIRFESLFRPAQSNRPGGLGVGLYQCKQIVEAHHGTIQIRSEVGRGTQVRIEWPVSCSLELAQVQAALASSMSHRVQAQS